MNLVVSLKKRGAIAPCGSISVSLALLSCRCPICDNSSADRTQLHSIDSLCISHCITVILSLGHTESFHCGRISIAGKQASIVAPHPSLPPLPLPFDVPRPFCLSWKTIPQYVHVGCTFSFRSQFSTKINRRFTSQMPVIIHLHRFLFQHCIFYMYTHFVVRLRLPERSGGTSCQLVGSSQSTSTK
jgi:hypothetical protein